MPCSTMKNRFHIWWVYHHTIRLVSWTSISILQQSSCGSSMQHIKLEWSSSSASFYHVSPCYQMAIRLSSGLEDIMSTSSASFSPTLSSSSSRILIQAWMRQSWFCTLHVMLDHFMCGLSTWNFQLFMDFGMNGSLAGLLGLVSSCVSCLSGHSMRSLQVLNSPLEHALTDVLRPKRLTDNLIEIKSQDKSIFYKNT